jgi:hypothetical protein
MAFKQQFFDKQTEPVCELTHEPIAFVGSHVDHIPPFTFEQLVKDFCEEYEIDLKAVPIRNDKGDNKYVDLLDDDRIAALWVEYHKRHAVLRVVSQRGNLSNNAAL